MTLKYDDKKLAKYEDTIRLYFEKTGKFAWLTLRNYGWLFQKAFPAVACLYQKLRRC